jgi:phenylacetate-coenzyme A ligase PaaK-like adenylate-forming protein
LNATRLAQSIRCVSGEVERSADELVAFQSARLRDLVRHAAAHVPLYRRKYREAGIDAREIRSLEDLRRLPFLDREELQHAGEQGCLTEGLDTRRLIEVHTSGSSGAPLTIWREPWENRVLLGLRLRKLYRVGLPLAGRLANLASQLPGVTYRKKWYEPLQVNLIDCLQPAEAMLAQLVELRPMAVTGYSGSLAEVARLMGPRERIKLPVRSVIGGGETVTEAMRSAIESGFGVPFFNTYGALESRLIALEGLERPGMTVIEAAVLVEVVDGDRPVREGETGEVVITALHSFAMPLIRYRLRDWAERGGVGVAGPLTTGSLGRVWGRVIEMFRLPSGRRYHPYAFGNPLVAEARWVRHFRIVQESAGCLRFDVVPWWGKAPGERELAALQLLMMQAAEEPLSVAVRVVDEIRPRANGKYQTYIAAPDGLSGETSPP